MLDFLCDFCLSASGRSLAVTKFSESICRRYLKRRGIQDRIVSRGVEISSKLRSNKFFEDCCILKKVGG